MSETWPQYLGRIGADSHEGAVAVLVWTSVASAVEGLPVPRAAYSPEEDPAVSLAWEGDEHYVDIDIMRGGAIEWFYRNRKTSVFDGSAGPEPAHALPARLIECLTQVASQRQSNEP